MMNQRDSTWISHWDPEDEEFWEATGKRVARRNLVWSILAEHLGFSIWLVWSIVATKLPQAGFYYTTDQLFQLVAVPGLIGSLMRFPYTFAVTAFGGRNWTIFSAAVLFLPVTLLAYFVGQPDAPFWLMLLVAATAGLGGGNFASSMANISFFYPDRMKGWALGLNAAGGNIGVSGVQLLTPILMGFGFVSLYLVDPGESGLYLQNAGLMWLLPLTIAVIGAWFFMNNLTDARSTLKDQLIIVCARSRNCSAARRTATTSRFSAPRRSPATTASSCPASSPARRSSTTSLPIPWAGMKRAASFCTQVIRWLRSTGMRGPCDRRRGSVSAMTGCCSPPARSRLRSRFRG
jgi:MFS family permease